MIIQGKAIQTNAGSSKVANHIFEGEQNEHIETLNGNRYDMQAMMDDADYHGKKYGFVHFKMNPKEPLTPEQEAIELKAIADEYKFSLDDSVIVKHTKPRADKTSSNEHYHIIAPYCDSKGKAMNLRSSYKRNEKLGRLAEMRAGQSLTNGRFNTSVFGQLVKEGKNLEALQVMTQTDNDKPFQSHTHKTEYALKKKKININAEKQTLKDLWKKSDSLKAYASALNESGYIMKEGDKPDTFIILKGTDFISAANRIVSMKKDDFKKLYEKEIQNVPNEEIKRPAKKASLIKKSVAKEADEYEDIDAPEYPELRTESENEAVSRHILRSEVSTQRDQSDLRTDSESPVRGTKSDRADTGIAKSDIEKSRGINESNVRNAQLVIATAKIKFSFSHEIEIRDISHVRPITPEYIQEIKARIKEEGKNDKEYFAGIYKNLKEQNREIYKYNKTIDNDAIALIIDVIMRLLFGVTIYKQQATPKPVDYPRIESPIDKQTFDSMSKRDRNSIVFSMFVQLRSSFNRHNNLMKKTEVGQAFPSFQAFLESYSGDWMADEIANIYQQQYIRELEKSENKADRAAGSELRKLLKGQDSEYTDWDQSGLKMCIESVHGEISHNIEQHIEAQKVRAEAEKIGKDWTAAIELQESMKDKTQTPDFDFVPADIIDQEEISSPRMR